MKLKLTRTKFSLILTLSLILFLNSAFAQTMLEVTAPGGIAGTYEMVPAGFGGDLPGCADMTPLSGELIIVEDGTAPTSDGCETITNDLTGKIAVIDRGTCEFGVKCLNAENAGAMMVIVCNNTSDDIISMGAGVVGDQVTIPALMISLDDCSTIRAEIPGATINIFWEPIVPSNDVVLWDDGQFDGGLGNWTTNAITPDTAVWTWAEYGVSSIGNRLYSPTVCNGAAIFDASFYNVDAVGNGEDHVGELISPVIDCSTFQYTSLKFYTYNLRLNGTTTFSVSIDGGATWGDETIITTENVFTADETSLVGTEIKRYLINEFPGEANCRIKFTFDDHRYFFLLDDVQLIQPERNNLALVNDFYGIAPNMVTPISQIEPFSFIADVANIGAETQTGIELEVSIDDNSGEVFSAIKEYDDLAGGETMFDQKFDEFFTPDPVVNDYDGQYELRADSVDFDPSDNFKFFSFSVSDTTFAKETGMTRTILPAANNWEGDMEPHSWAYGNYFHIVNGGDDWFASSATFGIGNADATGIAGRLITVYLYKWEKDATSVVDNNMDPEERTRIGFNVYEITGDELPTDLITVPLINFPSGEPGPIALEDDQAYVLMVEYATNDEVDFALVASEETNYSGMVFRSEETQDQAGPESRYAALLGVNGDLDSEPYSTVGFGRDIVPVVRLNISPKPDAVNNPLDAANIIQVSPNPADSKINLKVDLVETQENVSIRIFDVTGRLLLDQPQTNMKSEMLEFNVSNFTNGTYFLHFITEDGVRTERFIVQH